MKRGTWVVTLTFGRIEIRATECALSEQGAIDGALRYARALGYAGHPTAIHSWKLA